MSQHNSLGGAATPTFTQAEVDALEDILSDPDWTGEIDSLDISRGVIPKIKAILASSGSLGVVAREAPKLVPFGDRATEEAFIAARNASVPRDAGDEDRARKAIAGFFAVYDTHPDVYAVQRALNTLRSATSAPTQEEGK